jgi:hypothetical protein
MSSSTIRRALPANQVNANVSTAQVFSLISNPLAPVTVAAPGKLAIEQKRFTVRASGNLLTGTTSTAKATLLMAAAIPATPLTAANWTVVGAGTARSVASVWSPWLIESELQFESTGGTMQGTFRQLLNNLFDASAAISNVLTGINGTNQVQTQGGSPIAQQDPVIYFAVAITLGTANAGNLANLSELALDF